LQPRQHGGQRARVAQARAGNAFCFYKCRIEVFGDPRMLFVERAADSDEMHDRKKALALVQLAL